MSTEDQIDSLINKLETPDVLGFCPEERLGQPVYATLLSRLAARSLTKNQTANALVVLTRLRQLGPEAVFEVIVTSLAHDSARVRNQAARLAVGFMRDTRWQPPYYCAASIEALRGARDRGLDGDATKLVDTLITGDLSSLALK